jgi:hypothetical protein
LKRITITCTFNRDNENVRINCVSTEE